MKASSYDVETNSGSITVDGVKGSVRAHTGFGNIDIKNAEGVTLDLNTNSGSIDFLARSAKVRTVVHSDFGDIELNYPPSARSTLN